MIDWWDIFGSAIVIILIGGVICALTGGALWLLWWAFTTIVQWGCQTFFSVTVPFWVLVAMFILIWPGRQLLAGTLESVSSYGKKKIKKAEDENE